MSKTLQVLEHILVTFFEAVLAYYVAVGSPKFNTALVAGAIGAGLSAVYNVLRQSNPTIPSQQSTPPLATPPPSVPPASPAV